MHTIYQAEKALREHIQSEKTLKQYSVAVLRELCVKRGIQVDAGDSRRLKRPYIDALLTHVRELIVK
jgi:hypothetical protein